MARFKKYLKSMERKFNRMLRAQFEERYEGTMNLMEENGFHTYTPNEVVLYDFIGDRAFRKIINKAFERAYWEGRGYIGFAEFCHRERADVVKHELDKHLNMGTRWPNLIPTHSDIMHLIARRITWAANYA